MRFDDYLAKGRAKNSSLPNLEKRCNSCGAVLDADRTPSFLFRQRFCSDECKQEYVDNLSTPAVKRY